MVVTNTVTSDSVTITNWFKYENNKIEEFYFESTSESLNIEQIHEEVNAVDSGLFQEKISIVLNGSAVSESELEALNTNSDGIIDSNDTEFGNLEVWQDANEDGIGDVGEIKTLTEAGINSIRIENADVHTSGNGEYFNVNELVQVNNDEISSSISYEVPTVTEPEKLVKSSDLYGDITSTNRLEWVFPNPDEVQSGYLDHPEYSDDYTELGAGNDSINGYIGNDVLFGQTGNDQLLGWDGNDYLHGGQGLDALYGVSGSNYLDGDMDNDNIHTADGSGDYAFGGAGDDLINYYSALDFGAGEAPVGSGNDYIDGESGDDTIYSYLGDNTVYGGTGFDWIELGSGNDYINGEQDDDTLFGLIGDDTVVGGDGNDHVSGLVGYTDDNPLLEAGESDNDILLGGAGNDVLVGKLGNDTLIAGIGNDELLAGEGEDILYGEEGLDSLYGENGNDTLLGGADTDILKGGAGNDELYGGTGNDGLWGDVGDDLIAGGDGDDIISGFTEDADPKQTLETGETDNDTIYGEAGNDLAVGSVGDDFVSGGEGNDTLYGFTEPGATKTTLEINETDDDILSGNAGEDLLVGGFGNDTVFGGTENDELHGNEGDDFLYGESGNDNLSGEVGNDVLYGGEGDDTIAGETGNDKLYGGLGNDSLSGELGDDYFDGGVGFDTMQGGAGNDTYVVNSFNDVVNENAGEGQDKVFANITHVLSDNVEELKLIGSENIDATGNDLDNTISGNSGSNIIDGYVGADEMSGQEGDDVYYVDNINDVVNERANEGIDTVRSNISWALGNNVENIELTDAGDLNATGNAQDNTITGNAGNNILDGQSGDDTYFFSGNWGSDLVIDSSGNDKIQFGNDISIADIKISRDGDNIILSKSGSTDIITLQNWFLSVDNRVENLEFIDGTLNSTDIETLATNYNPVATVNTAILDEDDSVQIDVLTDATDADNDTLSVASFTQGANGSVSLGTNNKLIYVPVADFNGTDTFDYTISDGNGGTDTTTVTVNSINDNPVATVETTNTDEDNSVEIDVLAASSDVDNDTISIDSFTQGTNGTVANVDDKLVYTPNANFNGTDSFDYTISDGNGGLNTKTITVTVNSINDAPVATIETSTVDEDSSVIIDVLNNSSDVDNDMLVIDSFTQGTNGIVENIDDKLVYTPNANYNGADSFTYTISDGNGGTVTETVNLTVNAVNDAPTATATSANVDEDNSVTFNAITSVVSDVDGDILTIEPGASANNGLVSINGQDLTYTPGADFNGSDTITYTVSDGNGETVENTVNITVNAINDNPVATIESTTVDEDGSVNVDVISASSDVENDTLSIDSFTQGTNGSVDEIDGKLVYTPNADYHGTDSFDYTISDGNGGTDTKTVAVMVNSINDNPVATVNSSTVDEDSSVEIDILAGASDVENDTLNIDSFTQGANGAVTQDANDNLVYTPTSNFNGTDSFNYIISDGNGGTDEKTVTVTVNSINDAPTVTAFSESVNEDGSIIITNALHQDYASDVDGDTLTIKPNPTADNGSVSIDGNNLVYTPDENFNGTDTITYSISDGNGGIVPNTVTVNVASINDNPVATIETADTDEDNYIEIDVIVASSDVENDTLSIDSFTQGTNGIVTEVDGKLVYTPNADYNGTDSFDYTISDGNGGTDTKTVAVTINSINDNPTAAVLTETVDEDGQITIDGISSAQDIDGDLLTVDQNATALHGSVSVTGTNLEYTPEPNFNGEDTITYYISDGIGTPVENTVTMNVTPINDLPTVTPITGVDVVEDETTTITSALHSDYVSDVDGNPLSIEAGPTAENGTVSTDGTNLIYTPDANFNGEDTITYYVSDESGTLIENTVTVNVTPDTNFEFSNGDGSISIDNPSLYDTIQLGGGIAEANIELVRQADNLIINIIDMPIQDDQITIPDWFSPSGNKIENIEFSTGDPIISSADIESKITKFIGTDNPDNIIGNTNNNQIDGDLGADTLSGGLGDDTYLVDDAGDIVTENVNEGIDTVQSSIDYTLTGNVENLELTGTSDIDATGNDLNNAITGNSGNNVLDGGIGIDVLTGGAGNDTYIFNEGDGWDTITDTSGSDKIVLGEGITFDDFVLTRDNYNLDSLNIYFWNGEKITITDHYAGTDNKIETLELSDGSTYDLTDLNDLAVIVGTGGDDWIQIDEDTTCNTFYGGQGNDVILDTTNTIDTYIFALGDGQDTIADLSGDPDKILFGDGITLSSLEFTRDVNNLDDLTIKITGTTDQITIYKYYTGYYEAGDTTIETLEFSDGFTLDVVGMNNQVIINGTSGNDSIDVSDAFNNTYIGNEGNDYLADSGNSNDIYQFTSGDGIDTVNDALGTNDKIYFESADIKDTAVFYEDGFGNLYIDYGTTANSDLIGIQNSSTNTIERIELANGEYLTDGDVNQVIQDIIAYADTNSISLTSADDIRNNTDLMNIVTSSWNPA